MLSELSLTLRASPLVSDGTVRLDPADMRMLRVVPGEIVTLIGSRAYFARALPTSMEDRNQRLALVSPLSASNVGDPPPENVRVYAERKAPVFAETVTLAVEDDIDALHVAARRKLLQNYWHDRLVMPGDRLQVPSLDRNPLFVRVASTHPEGLAQITSGTSYILAPCKAHRNLPELAGLRDLYRTCLGLASGRLKADGAAGVGARSVLLKGACGCGKGQLLRRLGEELGVAVVALDAHALIDKALIAPGAESILSLTELERRGPALIVMDHLEALSPQGSTPQPLAVAARFALSQLCAVLDDIAMHPNVMAFGVASGEIDARFMTRGRFEVVLPVDPPNRLERHEILSMATRSLALAENVDLERLSEMTSGATGRDLCQIAGIAARLSQGPKVDRADFNDAARHIEFSAAREVKCDIPATSWQDVAGLDDIKQLLLETLLWSLKHYERFAQAGVAPPRSMLLSGGQGTGKTSLVRALANIVPLYFIEVTCSTLASYEVEEAARVVRESVAVARRKTPSLVFFDDIDVLFEIRGAPDGDTSTSPLVPHLLAELDRLAMIPDVVVVAATNRPDRLSAEILRPGRFDFAATLPMPDAAARKKILQIHARKLPLAADVDFDRLANLSQGLSPAEIANICNRVGLLALRQSLSEEHAGTLPPVANAALFEHVLRGRKG